MGALDDLKTRIDEAIYQNTQQKITGEVLQDTLEDMVDTMGVSVSQNTETGHTDISVGGVTTPVASINDIENVEQELNGNAKEFSSSTFGNNIFPYFFKAGRTYIITANRLLSQYTDLYAVNSDGTHESTKISTFVRDTPEEWTPSVDYYGLFTSIPNDETITINVLAAENAFEKIDALSDEVDGVESDNAKLEQEVSGGEQTVTRTGAAYYTIDYMFLKDRKYYISISTNAPNGVMIYAQKADGTHTQLISSFLDGDKKTFTPTEDYVGYFFGIASGISATITVKADNLTDNVNSIINAPIELYAYADGDSTPDDSTHFYGWKNGKCAWQRAIDSTDGISKYKIYCFGKVYVNSASQFFLGSNNYNNVVFIPNTKSNIELIGQGEDRTMLVVDMADDFADYATYQPMEVWGNNTVVRSMTITSKNARYCIHMDASGGRQADGFNISFYDVTMRHYHNAAQSFESPFGLGISDGMNLRTERCSFITSRNYIQPLYLHDNVNFTEDFVWTIKDCKLINPEIAAMTSDSPFITIQTLGSNIRGTIVFENNDMSDVCPLFGCENNNAQSKTNADKYDANVYVKITGNQDAPIGYETKNSTSAVLRVTSKSTGSSSVVRFDEESSAFDIIVRGLLPTGFTDIYGIVHTDGYQYRDGVTGLSGYAMGELAIDSNRIVSMQNRLGDCSSNNKSLGISVDGVDYTITFNQNYTSYTDEQMLQVFTDVIGSVADVELYNWGADYFPEIEPVLCTRRNTSNDVILKGMGVRLKGTLMTKATQDSEVDGIAIDDILPTYMGRVARKCTLNIYKSNHHHVALETYPADANDKYREPFVGNFGIGETAGVFKKMDGGILSVDYYGYVTLR